MFEQIQHPGNNFQKMFKVLNSFNCWSITFGCIKRDYNVWTIDCPGKKNQFVMMDYLPHLSSVGTGKGGII